MIEVVDDPRFPDRIGAVGAPLTPCKVTEIVATTAPSGRPRPGDAAVYDQVNQYRIRYELPPATVGLGATADLEAAIRARLAQRPLARDLQTDGDQARANAWMIRVQNALLAVLDLHKPTHYDGQIQYERREEPVFAADGTPRGVVEVRGAPLPPDWCAPCVEVTPCDEVRAIAKALGIEVG